MVFRDTCPRRAIVKSDQRSRETSVLVPLGQLAVSSGTFVKFASRHQGASNYTPCAGRSI